MADKKTTSKKAEKKVTNSVADLRAKSADELQKLLAVARKDLLEMQKSLKANELANPRAVTKARREIARILTVMHEVIARNEVTKQSSGKDLDRHADKSARDDKTASKKREEKE